MKTLALLRHAKSDWSDPGLGDFDRPLAPRGIKAAGRMGRALEALGLAPDLVLCSDARRARQTWDLVSAQINRMPRVELLHRLYLASPRAMLREIRVQDAGVACLLLIGHNPGMENLAAELVGPGSDPVAARSMAEKYPTAALAVLTFDLPTWREVQPGSGRLVRFLRPRELN